MTGTTALVARPVQGQGPTSARVGNQHMSQPTDRRGQQDGSRAGRQGADGGAEGSAGLGTWGAREDGALRSRRPTGPVKTGKRGGACTVSLVSCTEAVPNWRRDGRNVRRCRMLL